MAASSRRRQGSRPSARRIGGWVLVAAMAAAWAPRESTGQPLGAWLTTNRTSNRYIEISHSAALNPTSAFTAEAWVNISSLSSGECVSILGKGYVTTYWLGVCEVGGAARFRTYLRGSGSARTFGIVPIGQWTHLAVTFDGSRRRHFINGEEVFNEPEPGGALPTNASNVRIASDVNYNFQPQGSIDEVRIWNVARTLAQIRSTINVALTTAHPGLVAVWGLNGTPTAAVGPHNGSNVNSPGYFTFGPVASCGASTGTSLCLNDRFRITARHRVGDPGTAETQAQVVPVANPGSGLFYFFSVNNWEVMVKALNGCGLNNRHWIFSAATTNVFYRMEVHDVRGGVNKVYFNYPGPPAPAVTDTNAFATCP